MGLKQNILSLMQEEAYRPMDIQDLVKIFGISTKEYKTFKKIIRGMVVEGLVMRDSKEKLGLATRMGMVAGKIQIHQKGYGFVLPDEEGRKDVFIPKSNMGSAMNGDKVLARILKEDNDGKKCEGEIAQITERALNVIIGRYEDSKNFGFVIPDDKRMLKDIFVSKKDRHKAESGDIVQVEITRWPQEGKKPEGKIVEVLGRKGDSGLDIISVIKRYALPEEFPEEVLEAADEITEDIPETEINRRTDFRDLRMVTIDGEDAKDLDDAVSIERLDGGLYRLGVHIADVTHYVREGSPLDEEALKRATSVYLVDRVIPMLPRKLSNGICSLNPQVDRLTLSCMMTLNENGKVINHEVHESVIRTNERMTYTAVTDILKGDKELNEKYDYLVDDFKAMQELALILNKKRMDRGAIDFEFPECKIILNDAGKAVDIKPYERGISNRMIEEFMLACNETVSEHFFWAGVPFVYRIHEEPNPEKLDKFKDFVKNLGYSINWGNEITPKSISEVANMVKGKDEENVVSTLLLRCMMQAKYSEVHDGHFGLAAEYYSHFTSPIRRYPDLQIHRIIKESLNGKIDDERSKELSKAVAFSSKQSSEMERVAQDAEREVDDLKKAEYMKDKVGMEFDGIISSVTSFGVFVQLPNTVEGLIHITDFKDDYYVFDDVRLSLIGERNKKLYTLGDKMKVLCAKVDVDNREVYFAIAEDKYMKEAREKKEAAEALEN
ncbi:ribonuclease R [uncultured Clostridium sp.]|uniref:ribonuclease R n=1 Tax=uncultured Clostridium sp. TaxID=59620 RepID=UPI002637EB2B|nr:ribonuclease R [uncultured Clostridium sp.]